MRSRIIFTFLLFNLLNMNIEGNDNSKHKDEHLIKPVDEAPTEVNSAPDPSSVFENNQNNPNYYPNGNVHFEIVGDSSHLFDAEDFEKVEVKPLRSSTEESLIKNEADVDHVIFEDNDEETKQLQAGFNQTQSDLNDSNSTNSTMTDKAAKAEIKCNLKNLTNETVDFENRVRLVNGTTLTSLLAESKSNDCFVVMFYVPWCPFSTRLAPNFNALPRAFNQLDILAFDVSKSTGYNTKFGANAVPMVIIFQQKNVVSKFNHTHKNLTDLVDFVAKNTGITGNTSIVQLAADLEGPVPTVPVERFDYGLFLSWIFLLFVAVKVLFQRLGLYVQLKRLFSKYFNYHHHND